MRVLGINRLSPSEPPIQTAGTNRSTTALLDYVTLPAALYARLYQNDRTIITHRLGTSSSPIASGALPDGEACVQWELEGDS